MCNDLATLTMFVPCLVPFLIMLLTPKLIGVLDTIRKRRLDWAEARSFALEVPFSLLLAPLLIYLHTTFVLGILRGQVTPWISPSRNPGETLPLRTAVRMFWLPGIAAVGLTALAWWLVPSFLVYLLAIIVGWVFAIPLATGSSQPVRMKALWAERIPYITGIVQSAQTPTILQRPILTIQDIQLRHTSKSACGFDLATSLRNLSTSFSPNGLASSSTGLLRFRANLRSFSTIAQNPSMLSAKQTGDQEPVSWAAVNTGICFSPKSTKIGSPARPSCPITSHPFCQFAPEYPSCKASSCCNGDISIDENPIATTDELK